jgi:lipid-A-disaccharide synthase
MGSAGMTDDAAELRERDQSGSSGKINAEVRASAIFTILGENGGVFHGQSADPPLACAGMSKRLYVVAGELSGDAHGAGLLRALKPMVSGLEIHGVGGPKMAEIAGHGLCDWVEDAAVMGVWEVLKRYGWFKERFARMLAELKEFRPDVLLLIDYPGFNLRFAEAVKRECPETRVVYYVSPQVWAWNKGRIPKMVRLLDEMLCLFPFEQPIFQNAGLKTTFAGHPLVDELAEKLMAGETRVENLVGLFPGSREREVASLFPMMIETAKRLKSWRGDLTFEVPAASAKLAAQIRGLMAEAGAADLIQVNTGESHSLMQRACCAVIASGTATLEAAYFGLPYCLVYRVAPLTYLMAKLLVKIKFIGIVNILAGKEVVREFIQADANAGAVSDALKDFLQSPEKRANLQARLAETTAKLGGSGAHERAARVVAAWLAGTGEAG